MKKPFLLLGFLIFTVIALFGVRTFVSNRISTSGVELGSTQDQLKTYQTQNILLREKLYGLASLNHVASAAAKMGFVDSKASLTLANGIPLARR